MKCPDCGQMLHQMSFLGVDKSFRCFRCGGFWVEGWIVNRLEAKMLTRWTRLEIDPGWLTLGNNTCPVDGTTLLRHSGDNVPAHIVIKRCEMCGRWWFPTDNLLLYRPAVEAKVNFVKLWGLTADVASMTLPALIVLVAILGIVAGVRLVQVRQQSAIQASEAR